MKKKIFMSALSLCVLVVLSLTFLPAASGIEQPAKVEVNNKALSARFTNMLNRNFSYDSDYNSVDAMVENSVFALLDKRDRENPDYIQEAILKGFIKDMYGIEITEIVESTSNHKDGFVYILPRGYTEYKHSIKSIKPNEDGSFTVESSVTVSPHDDCQFTTSAQTLFVPNEKSAFGYNIVYSNLVGMQTRV